MPRGSGISISSLLGDDQPDKKESKDSKDDSVIIVEESENEEDEAELISHEVLKTATQPGKVDIGSILSKNDSNTDKEKPAEKPAPKKRKPRTVKKKDENSKQTTSKATSENKTSSDKSNTTPSKQSNILSLIDTNEKPALLPSPFANVSSYQENIEITKPPILPSTRMITHLPPLISNTAPLNSQVNDATSQNNSTTIINGQTSTDSNATSNTGTTPTVKKEKAKATKAVKKPADNSKEKKEKPKKEVKKKEITKAVEKKETTPQPVLSPDQINNQSLKQPKANGNLPPPKVVEIQSSNDNATASPKEVGTNNNNSTPGSNNVISNEPIIEPIIALHVPLRTDDEEPGTTQVVFNVLKMAEDKYGWKNIHPNASKFAMDLLPDDDIDDIDDDGDLEEEEEVKEPQQPVKVDGRTLQKGKPKVGQYDKDDPFIDDTEMLWEEQRASTKDGFFVYYGPLIEEGKNAVIERADGTIKRGRKRPASNAVSSNNRKKPSNTTTRNTTPKALVSIAPQPSK